jgi:hypothetical protein
MSIIADMETILDDIESSIFLSSKPDSPNYVCVLYDTGGYNPSHSFTSIEYNQPTFQVCIRDIDYENGYSRCEAICKTLDGITNRVLNNKMYLSIFQQGEILPIGEDSMNRHEFTINFKCKVKK